MRIDNYKQFKTLVGKTIEVVERFGQPASGVCVVKKITDTAMHVSPTTDLEHTTLILVNSKTFRPDPDGFSIVTPLGSKAMKFRVNQ